MQFLKALGFTIIVTGVFTLGIGFVIWAMDTALSWLLGLRQ